MKDPSSIIKLEGNPFLFKLFLLKKLPLAFVAGLKVVELEEHTARVSLPYNYLTKNPFRSIYFAALSMAAELSSGILAMAIVKDLPQPVSMLVLGMSADFSKKARSKITFSCMEGKAILETIQKSIETQQGQTLKVTVVGHDVTGDEVAQFTFNWTFKPKFKN